MQCCMGWAKIPLVVHGGVLFYMKKTRKLRFDAHSSDRNEQGRPGPNDHLCMQCEGSKPSLFSFLRMTLVFLCLFSAIRLSPSCCHSEILCKMPRQKFFDGSFQVSNEDPRTISCWNPAPEYVRPFNSSTELLDIWIRGYYLLDDTHFGFPIKPPNSPARAPNVMHDRVRVHSVKTQVQTNIVLTGQGEMGFLPGAWS
ncbi:hypothetical protein VNO77_34748 [Canavalia gladiata]|uniref:Uncharacterized protein n=1 Tax=Canavalia gladiata TaxID=3824 RepID=A0AAN9Q011_CANGL